MKLPFSSARIKYVTTLNSILNIAKNEIETPIKITESITTNKFDKEEKKPKKILEKKKSLTTQKKKDNIYSKFYFPLFKFEKKFYKITLEKFKFKTKLSIILFYFKRLNLFKKKFSWKNLPNEI